MGAITSWFDVIIGIGTNLFNQFTQGFAGDQPASQDVRAIALAALSLLGLGIYGPGIATGLAAGGPQLGAGAAIGSVSTAWGVGRAAPATVMAAGSTASGVSAAVPHGGRRAVSFASGRGLSTGSDGGNGGPPGDSGSPPPGRAGSSAGIEPGPWHPGLGAAGRRSRRGCDPNPRPGTGAHDPRPAPHRACRP
jgi:type IV secretion system protein TrbL